MITVPDNVWGPMWHLRYVMLQPALVVAAEPPPLAIMCSCRDGDDRTSTLSSGEPPASQTLGQAAADLPGCSYQVRLQRAAALAKGVRVFYPKP